MISLNGCLSLYSICMLGVGGNFAGTRTRHYTGIAGPYRVVYAIKDKRNDRVVYVGSSFRQLWVQWAFHLQTCRQPRDEIHKYMVANGPLNFEPVMLEEPDLSELRECKKKWKDYFTV